MARMPLSSKNILKFPMSKQSEMFDTMMKANFYCYIFRLNVYIFINCAVQYIIYIFSYMHFDVSQYI